DEIRVLKRDASGRAEVVAVRGERQRVLRGWDFKTIVGRTLGWNVLKSSRFTVERAGANFIFRGSGFGHGLGLCQMGAHVQARTASAASSAARLTLASEHFRVSYTAQAERRDVEDVLRTLEAARTDMQQRLAAASLDLPALPVLEIVAHETTGEFVGTTGQPAWAAAATRGRRIELQPLATLRKRGVLTTTLRHEYAHAVIDALSKGRAPRWLAEGLAVYAAGEGVMLARVAAPKQRLSTDELEQQLAQPASAAEMRALYAAAYREVLALIRKEGEPRV